MKQRIINSIGRVAFHLGRVYGSFPRKDKKTDIFFFLPLATIGGVELVHLDILKALEGKKATSIFWNKVSPFLSTRTKLETIDPEYAKFGATIVFEELITSRFQQWQEAYEFGKIWAAMNRKGKLVILRNGDVKFKQLFKKFGTTKKFRLLIITHNAYAEFFSPGELMEYLDLDIQERIDSRVLISDSLSEVIEKTRVSSGIAVKVKEHVIYNAVQTTPLSEKNFDHIHLLFAGRDVQEKRFYLIHDIAESLADNPKFTFHFAGPDGGNYSVTPNMKFYGEVKDQAQMHSLYEKCQGFILLSKSEGFPRSIAEAMITGSIILTTKVGSIKDHVSSANGLLIDATDDQVIKEAVLEYLAYLAAHPKECQEISMRNREYALTNFSEELFRQKYRKLLDENC